jgi:hypothetical protein
MIKNKLLNKDELKYIENYADSENMSYKPSESL